MRDARCEMREARGNGRRFVSRPRRVQEISISLIGMSPGAGLLGGEEVALIDEAGSGFGVGLGFEDEAGAQ